MSPEIADLDRRIRACMKKHGITDADLRHARRVAAFARIRVSVAEITASMSAFGDALQRAGDQIRKSLPALRELAAGNPLPTNKEN